MRETDKMSLSSVREASGVGDEHCDDEKESGHTFPELMRILNVVHDPNVHCQPARSQV